MRRNSLLSAQHQLSPRQAFFATCWFNMVHKASLDSYRVRTMNPQNILSEFLRMYQPPGDNADRRHIAEEALEILAKEPIFDSDRYKAPKNEFVELLGKAIKIKDSSDTDQENVDEKTKPGEKSEKNGILKYATLLQSFAHELLELVQVHYLNDCFTWLEEAIAKDDLQLTSDEKNLDYESLERVCRNLLSIILDNGLSIESLFQHCRSMLKLPFSPAKNINGADRSLVSVPAYNFAENFQILRTRIMSPKKAHNVVFALHNVSKPTAFPEKIGTLQFQAAPPLLHADSKPPAKKYASAAANKIFVSSTVEAKGGREAGMIAYRQIGEILDLVRFEYEPSKITLPETFLLTANEGRYKLLTIPQVIPNPETELPLLKLDEFIQSLDELMKRGALHDDARDRIFSAFRLYRVGADSNIFENKLVNWWTALEYLVKGGKSGGGSIGGGVESALAPTLCLAYLPKHLLAYRSILSELSAPILDADQQPIDFLAMTNIQMYKALKDPLMLQKLEIACTAEPFLWHHLKFFIAAIGSPGKLSILVKNHERRIRWQIQRIYRARCDIVHSGHVILNISLLCANLEYYLKDVLHSMLNSFQVIPTLRGPHEFFERTKHFYERAQVQLNAKQPREDLFISSLDR